MSEDLKCALGFIALVIILGLMFFISFNNGLEINREIQLDRNKKLLEAVKVWRGK